MDFIPGSDGAFLEFATTFSLAVQAQAQTLGIPQDVVSNLTAKKAAFASAYAAAQLPTHSSIDIALKNEKRRELERCIRHVKKAYLDPVEDLPDSTWESFGIKPPDRIHTPKPTPGTRPVVRPELSPPGLIRFIFHAEGKNWGKDPDAHGLELCWAILDHAPASIDELAHSSFETKSPLTLTFDISDRGKTLYYIARWESGTARKGPWTEVESVIIP